MKTYPGSYYDRHQFLYNLLWSRRALHYGLWASGVRTFTEAIEQTNRVVIAAAEIGREDHVLDLGCGTGGTAVSIAQQTGARLTGMTISQKQYRQAVALAKAAGVSDRVEFICANFEQPLPFPDNTFSVVSAVESFCHAHDKVKVLAEIHRVVLPGGRIVMIDGFLRKEVLQSDERRLYDVCRRGWQVPSLLNLTEIEQVFRRAGFDHVVSIDRTSEILRSSDRIRQLGLLTFLPAWLLTVLRIAPLYDNAACMVAQRRMFHDLARYGIVTARAR